MKQQIRILLKRNTPRWIVLSIDMYVTLTTFILAYIISNKLKLDGLKDTGPWLIEVLGSALFVFLLTRSYRGIIRHTSFKDASRVFYSGLLLSGILAILSLLFRQFPATVELTIPLHIVITHFLLNTILLVFLRVLYKTFYQHYIYSKKGESRVLY